MKKCFYVLLILVSTSFVGCGKDQSTQSTGLVNSNSLASMQVSIPEEVTLTPRDTSTGNLSYRNSAFNFQKMTQNMEIAGNQNDIWLLDSGYEIGVGGSVASTGQLVDLGKISCADIKNLYEHEGPEPAKGSGGYPHKVDRKRDPMFWMIYSEAWRKLRDNEGKTNLIPVEGHCYLVNRVDDSGRIVAVFNVKKYVAGQSVTINELEVFDKSVFKY